MGCVSFGQEPVHQCDVGVWVEVDLQDASVGKQHRSGLEQLGNGDVDGDEREAAGVLWLEQVVPVDQDAQHVPKVLAQVTPKLCLVEVELDAEFCALGLFLQNEVEQGAQQLEVLVTQLFSAHLQQVQYFH